MTSIRVRVGEAALWGRRKDLVLDEHGAAVIALSGAVERRLAFEELTEILVRQDTRAHVNHRHRMDLKITTGTGEVLSFGSFQRDAAEFYDLLARRLAASGLLGLLKAGRKEQPFRRLNAAAMVGVAGFSTVGMLRSEQYLLALVLAVLAALALRAVFRKVSEPRAFDCVEDAIGANPMRKAVWSFSIN